MKLLDNLTSLSPSPFSERGGRFLEGVEPHCHPRIDVSKCSADNTMAEGGYCHARIKI